MTKRVGHHAKGVVIPCYGTATSDTIALVLCATKRHHTDGVE
ncbi:MAG: hypothetical protein ABIT20_15190 [Gemmatimonadaceae bacterium]